MEENRLMSPENLLQGSAVAQKMSGACPVFAEFVFLAGTACDDGSGRDVRAIALGESVRYIRMQGGSASLRARLLRRAAAAEDVLDRMVPFVAGVFEDLVFGIAV